MFLNSDGFSYIQQQITGKRISKMRLGISRFHRIDDNYKIREKIGSDSFRDVYRVTARNGIHYAAKFVPERHLHFLNNEREIMQRANHSQRQLGTPYWHYFGKHGENYVLVMDLFGNSLRTLVQNYGRLSLKSVLLIGIQLTSLVESLHNRGYIHRHIKPGNLVIGKDESDRKSFYLIGFGLARQFQDAHGVYHMLTVGRNWYGSNIFAARQAHRQEPESWRSDFQSVIYLIIYLLKHLPWDCEPALDSISTVILKENATADVLCGGLPGGIREYYLHVMGLGYFERPDCERLRGYLRRVLREHGYVDDEFEWTTES